MSKASDKNKSVAKIVVLVLVAIIALVTAVSGFLLTHYAGLLGDLREEERGNAVSESNEATPNGEQIVAPTNIGDDVFTILLIGVDSRQDTYTGRSDTQMMISINQKQKKLVIASLLRDCYVSIPGHGNNRINAAYAFGGTNLLLLSSTSKRSRTLSTRSGEWTSMSPKRRSNTSTTARADICRSPVSIT